MDGSQLFVTIKKQRLVRLFLYFLHAFRYFRCIRNVLIIFGRLWWWLFVFLLFTVLFTYNLFVWWLFILLVVIAAAISPPWVVGAFIALAVFLVLVARVRPAGVTRWTFCLPWTRWVVVAFAFIFFFWTWFCFIICLFPTYICLLTISLCRATTLIFINNNFWLCLW